MRKIDYIVVHCTATPQTTSIQSIQNYWRNNLGWKLPGYHFIVKPNGDIVQLLTIATPSNGVGGHNSDSIHISYIGGQYKDDRTAEQKVAIINKLIELKKMFPKAKILGHRDFAGVKKACPQFNAIPEYNNI